MGTQKDIFPNYSIVWRLSGAGTVSFELNGQEINITEDAPVTTNSVNLPKGSLTVKGVSYNGETGESLTIVVEPDLVKATLGPYAPVMGLNAGSDRMNVLFAIDSDGIMIVGEIDIEVDTPPA